MIYDKCFLKCIFLKIFLFHHLRNYYLSLICKYFFPVNLNIQTLPGFNVKLSSPVAGVNVSLNHYMIPDAYLDSTSYLVTHFFMFSENGLVWPQFSSTVVQTACWAEFCLQSQHKIKLDPIYYFLNIHYRLKSSVHVIPNTFFFV